MHQWRHRSGVGILRRGLRRDLVSSHGNSPRGSVPSRRGERGYANEEGVKETWRALVPPGGPRMNLERRRAQKGARAAGPLAEQLAQSPRAWKPSRAGQRVFLTLRGSIHVMTEIKKSMEGVSRGHAYAEAGGDCIYT